MSTDFAYQVDIFFAILYNLVEVLMTVRQSVLDILESNRGDYLTGSRLADMLGVTRSAINKAISHLIDDGYEIQVSRRGYMLEESISVLTDSGIARYLHSSIPYTLYEEVSSTNDLAKRAGIFGEVEQVVIASSQTAGRGRRGREFFSSKGSGIYLSILLRPHMSAQDTLGLTTMTAVSVVDAIRSETGIDAGIKWVNDVYVDGLKVSGILTEAGYGIETGSVDYVVIGVGINVAKPRGDYPSSIRGIAGALFDVPPREVANRLTARVIDNILEGYQRMSEGDYSHVDKYRSASILIGRQVYLPDGEEVSVEDIDDKCALVVRHLDGSISHLSSGEVSVRLV